MIMQSLVVEQLNVERQNDLYKAAARVQVGQVPDTDARTGRIRSFANAAGRLIGRRPVLSQPVAGKSAVVAGR